MCPVNSGFVSVVKSLVLYFRFGQTSDRAREEPARAVRGLDEQRAAGLGAEIGGMDGVGAEAEQRLALRVEDVGGVGAC